MCAHTNSNEQSSSREANSSSSSQKIPHTLWYPKIHYYVHKMLPPVSTLSQITLVHTFPPYFLKIHFNIILPAMHKRSKWSLSSKFPHQKPVCILLLPHAFHMLNPAHVLESTTQIILGVGVEIMKLIMNFSPVVYYLPPLIPKCGPGSIVGIVTAYGPDGLGIESQWGQDFLHLSRLALRLTQPPVQCVPGLSWG